MTGRTVVLGLAICVLTGFSAWAIGDDPPAAPEPASPAAGEAEAVELTNYRSGISLTVEGRCGKDYAVERFWHDALNDDRCAIYIRDATTFTLEHNERNTMHSDTSAPFAEVGVNGKDGKAASGDEGIIRYKVDRDQQVGLSWSERSGKTHKPGAVCPRYEKPLSFAALAHEPGVSVVGSIGAKPGAEPGPELYYRGVLDAFGDEWHTLTVADDDGAFQDDYYSHKWASDGKVFLFVVNPKTPCLSLVTRRPEAQYYTTPAKTYFLPRIHEQTSYVTGGVDVVLANVTSDAPLSYRIDGGEVVRYGGPVSTDALAEGRHTLEYWFEGGAKKTRVIVKNPPHPSAVEQHGRLLWADGAEREGIKARLQREPYKTAWQSVRTNWSGQAAADKVLGRGGRIWISAALENALVACFDGVDARAPKAERTYAAYSKQMLLDSLLTIDPVGLELSHNFSPMPGAEWNSFGYYVVNPVFDAALAYDLLISFYRADQSPGGITPIEDLKIRDLLARWVVVQLQELRGFEGAALRGQQPDPSPQLGMWDCARLCGAAVCTMAMPAYDTPYYGTSGFDGTKATHKDVPFAGQAFTWKQLLLDADQSVAATPKLRRRFNHLDGGLVAEDGHFFDRPGYYSYGLMGHCFMILANTAKNACGKEWPYLEKSFQQAAEGTLEGRKINSPGDKGPRRYVQALLVNPRFPEVSETIHQFVKDQPAKLPDGGRNDSNPGVLMYLTKPYGLIWYQDDWQQNPPRTSAPR